MADKLIRLTSNYSALASDILSVEINCNGCIVVTTSTGKHHVDAGYGELVHRARDRLIDEINKALE
jgi:vacuolar-type H+-ATPase subunit E/Vma4